MQFCYRYPLIILIASGYTYASQYYFSAKRLTAPAHSGLQLLTQIIIADITVLKWRGLVSSLVSAPFIINAFVGSLISSSVLEHSSWRWGCG